MSVPTGEAKVLVNTEVEMKNIQDNYKDKQCKRRSLIGFLCILLVIIGLLVTLLMVKSNIFSTNESSNNFTDNNGINKDNCPESSINIETKFGETINIKQLIIENGKQYNETLDDYLADLLVDEYLLSLMPPLPDSGARRLAVTPFYGDNQGAGLTGPLLIASATPGQTLRAIHVWYGQYVHGISALFNGEGIWRTRGSTTGSVQVFDASLGPSGSAECVTAGNVRHGAIIDALQFVSANGRISPHYGGGGGGLSPWNLDACVTKITVKEGIMNGIIIISAIKFES